MAKIGYSIEGAARAAGVTERDIEVAINAGQIIARQAGAGVVIPATVLAEWVTSLPVWEAV